MGDEVREVIGTRSWRAWWVTVRTLVIVLSEEGATAKI